MTKNIAMGVYEAARALVPTASARWLASRGLKPPAGDRWKVTIVLDAQRPRGAAIDNTWLHVMIEDHEWSVFFCHGSGTSWIRVASAPRVHERDDFGLLAHVTDLRGLGHIIQRVEQQFGLQFRRQHATIHTNLGDAHQKILLWVVAAL